MSRAGGFWNERDEYCRATILRVGPAKGSIVKFPRVNFGTLMTGAAVLILLAAVPSALRDMFETGRVYLFSQQFLEDLPQRLTGPGRLRFILQPCCLVRFVGDAAHEMPCPKVADEFSILPNLSKFAVITG